MGNAATVARRKSSYEKPTAVKAIIDKLAAQKPDKGEEPTHQGIRS